MESNSDRFSCDILMGIMEDVMSYFGWDGRDDFAAIHKLFAALDLLVRTGINNHI
jgi:hypothetical protein